MNRIKQNLYTVEDIKYIRELGYHYEQLENDHLYSHTSSGRIYPTKLTKENLPEWYVFGRYYKRWGYINTKGIKDMKYKPCYINHLLRDDTLFISYNKKIEEDEHGWLKSDLRVWGNEIIDVLLAAEKYSNYDITEIKQQIEDKRMWLKDNEPEEYEKCKDYNLWSD